jgi:hypothetical protein
MPAIAIATAVGLCRRETTAAVTGTEARLPACMTTHTGERNAGLMLLMARNHRSSVALIVPRAALRANTTNAIELTAATAVS